MNDLGLAILGILAENPTLPFAEIVAHLRLSGFPLTAITIKDAHCCLKRLVKAGKVTSEEADSGTARLYSVARSA